MAIGSWLGEGCAGPEVNYDGDLVPDVHGICAGAGLLLRASLCRCDKGDVIPPVTAAVAESCKVKETSQGKPTKSPRIKGIGEVLPRCC